MRIERIQTKIADELPIPDDLMDFLQEVNNLIEQNDEIAIIESDDLIQTEFAYGGLIEEGTDRYSFVYFPEEKTRPKWTIELTASEIAEISIGKKKTLYLWKCQNMECKSFFSSETGACFDCDYVDDELDARNRILNILSQSLTREEWVRDYLISFPDAHPLAIIGDYNLQVQLNKDWGYFSLHEMESLIEQLKGGNAT